MECKKCGASLTDEAIFCNCCGVRVDGKKLCENCQNWNDEGNIFCNFCGTRIDGKQTCSICGAIVEGAFCPYCGNKTEKEVSTRKNHTAQKNKEKKEEAFLNKLFYHLGNGSLMIGVLFALIFVFFFTVKLVITAEGETISLAKHNIFYFFGDYYKDVEDLNGQSLGEATAWLKNLTSAQVILYGVIGTIISTVTLLSVVSFGITAIVVYIVDLISKKQKRMDTWALACILAFFGGAAMLFLHTRISGSSLAYDGTEVKLATKFNGVTVIGLIFCVVFAIIGFVFRVINKGKSLWQNKALIKTIFAIIGTVFSIVLFILATNLAFSGKTNIESDGGVKICLQSGNLLYNCVADILLATSLTKAYYHYAAITECLDLMNTFNIFAQIFAITLIVFSVFAIHANVQNTVGNKNWGIVWSAISFVSSVLTLIFTILAFSKFVAITKFLAKDLFTSNIELVVSLGVPIVAVVFSALLLAVSIVCKILEKKEEK